MVQKGERTRYQRVRVDSGHHARILLVALLLGALAFLPVVAQLGSLMVLQHEYYGGLALRNQTRTTVVTADRGDILDRNMNILATSVGVENVYLDPQELKQSKADIPAMARALGEILERDAAWIEDQARDLKKRYKQIAARVSTQLAGQIRAYIQETGIAGIHLEPSSQRLYPMGTLAAQVIGFTNASNDGCEGIESAYDSFLKGTDGRVVTSKGNNEMDMPYSFEQFVGAQPGCDVVLTLDMTVQQCLEKRLEEAISKYAVQNGAFGMVMNVNTGEILAMATLGSYDPNNYLEIYNDAAAAEVEELRLSYLAQPEGSDAYFSGKEKYQQALNAARLKQWRNRCISDGYEPGSTFKVLTMAAALDSGAVKLTDHFSCGGSAHIPGRSQLLHCWRSAGHGSQTTAQAIQNSCNLAFANIALRMGGETFYEYVQRFGVLEKTGIDLAGESKGVFFSKELVTNTDKWGTASLTSGSFGQTFKLTPLQLVRAISSVVNGGHLMEPYIVSEVLDTKGNTVLKQEPTELRQVISQETSKTMRELLKSVVTEGTAKNASVAGFSIGGKTGTSEKIDVLDENGKPTLDKIVSFVGVAPMEDPQYIVLVALDTPSRSTGLYISGGQMAAPTVGLLMSDLLPYFGVERTEEPQVTVMEDFTGLTQRDAEKLLKERNLTARIVGSGSEITGQIPAAGMEVATGSQVILYMGEPAPTGTVKVPDFTGMNRQQAADAAAGAGLYILVEGNTDMGPSVVVTSQDIPAGTEVEPGTTLRLQFIDTKDRP